MAWPAYRYGYFPYKLDFFAFLLLSSHQWYQVFVLSSTGCEPFNWRPVLSILQLDLSNWRPVPHSARATVPFSECDYDLPTWFIMPIGRQECPVKKQQYTLGHINVFLWIMRVQFPSLVLIPNVSETALSMTGLWPDAASFIAVWDDLLRFKHTLIWSPMFRMDANILNRLRNRNLLNQLSFWCSIISV